MAVKLTPMMQQYMECKERYPDAILFFRLGDFYEMFFEDAEVVARELGLTLTARSKEKDGGIPMAGVPHHASQGYIAQLIEKGFTVAVAEQLEDASTTKGMVRRDVVRVITPGVVLDTDNLDARAPNYVAAIDTLGEGFGTGFAIAYLDVSTGDFRATEVSSVQDLVSELHRVEAREILAPEYAQGVIEPLQTQLPKVFWRFKHRAYFDAEGLVKTVAKGPRLKEDLENDSYFMDDVQVQSVLAGLNQIDFLFPELVQSASAAVLRYIVKTQRGVPSHVRTIEPYRTSAFLLLDDSTKSNLELTETLMGGKKKGSLLSILDHTVTSAGGRRLRQWLAYPLIDSMQITARHDAVEEFIKYPALRQDVRKALDEVYDIERLCGRLSSGSANPRDLRSLLSTLEVLPQVKDVLQECQADLLIDLQESIDPCEELCALIDSAIVEAPPVTITEGGIFKMGFNDELDEILDLANHGVDWILKYEVAQKEETGISSVKVKFNKVFGYFLEVTKSNLDRVPDTYIRKQTLANAERYITPELKEMEDKILHSTERRQVLERQLFEELRQQIAGHLGRLMNTASQLANLDVLSSLAELAQKREYVRPTLNNNGDIKIVEGRHPVVETTMTGGERFVPNDVDLGNDHRLAIITGPNMAGKSTVIRQVALITLLAQMGSYVPAKEANIGVVDKIFSRVGASDNLAKGQSTFMVEMTETAHILTNATNRSLVILDEIGRGTATYDGLSIAWAVAEYLHNVLGAKTLFATHYHELTELADALQGAFNMSIAVKEWQDNIIFLRKLVDGPANRSYGIQVGRLAGLPDHVVDRAKGILVLLEAGHFDQLEADGEQKDPEQFKAEKAKAAQAREKLESSHPARMDAQSLANKASKPAEKVEESVAVEPVATPKQVAPKEAPAAPEPQLSLFGSAQGPSPTEQSVLEELRKVSVGNMTPIEALVMLDKLARQLISER